MVNEKLKNIQTMFEKSDNSVIFTVCLTTGLRFGKVTKSYLNGCENSNETRKSHYHYPFTPRICNTFRFFFSLLFYPP